MIADCSAVAAQTLALLCLYQAAGAAFFMAAFGSQLTGTRAAIVRLTTAAACCGGVLVLLQPLLTAVRMAGEWGGALDGPLLRLAWHSSRGAAALAEFGGLSLILLALHGRGEAGRHSRMRPAILGLGGALVACAGALSGHTSVDPHRALLAPLLCVHLLVVAFWFGALAPLWLTIRQQAPREALSVLRGFSAAAVWLVPCIALAGLAMAWVLIDDASGWRRPYGLLLLGKLCLFGLLMGLAALNRWRLMPALAAAPEPTRRALQRSIVAESALIAAVFAMTSTLTTLFSPGD